MSEGDLNEKTLILLLLGDGPWGWEILKKVGATWKQEPG